MNQIIINTHGEGFYDVTKDIQAQLQKDSFDSGLLILFCPHTSCALTISEAYDATAKNDLENFLKHLAPKTLPFIKHTAEGPDDSPSHMKSILLQQSLTLIVEDGHVQLGTWQGIYLAEFRQQPHLRKIWLKKLLSNK